MVVGPVSGLETETLRRRQQMQLEGEETKTWRFFKNEQGWRGSERSRCEGQHMLDVVETKPKGPGLDVSRGGTAQLVRMELPGKRSRGRPEMRI